MISILLGNIKIAILKLLFYTFIHLLIFLYLRSKNCFLEMNNILQSQFKDSLKVFKIETKR